MNIIKTSIRYFIWILSFFLSYIIPKKNNLYIFWGINWKTFSWNSKAMFLYYLKNDKSKEIYYMTRNRNLLNLKIPNIIYINSFKWYLIFLRAKIIFTDSDLYDVNPWLSFQFWKFNIINLRHWEPIKKIWFDVFSNKISLSKKLYTSYMKKVIFTTTSSDSTLKTINTAFLNTWKITWLARNDIFFLKNLEIYNVKDELNICDNKKIILYTPTWRDNWGMKKPFTYNFLIQLNNFLEEENYILLLKTHHLWNKIFWEYFNNIIDISDSKIDIQEILKLTDILISDYSSIIIDFLLTDKPIIFYAYDIEEYISNRELYYDFENIVIKKGLAKNQESLFHLLKVLIKKDYPINYKKEYTKLKNKFHKYQKWWYIEKIINELEKIY